MLRLSLAVCAGRGQQFTLKVEYNKDSWFNLFHVQSLQNHIHP